ncbi:unnamed protein product [Vitrella brassicaformis CCMP3155]|uniref:Uncharacterized protein n=1 Tax=Vitrella brassicaformis (strain CCMP3155) TaxID=1169540 RepID=A0A0G4GAZ2_VITBC|nr:unnamed protein product [Vitrella brassicaformis CCMP3155]|eukprot:CEM26299.1 unnamed protein product [Vitrella brassicaformis CCMP3155]
MPATRPSISSPTTLRLWYGSYGFQYSNSPFITESTRRGVKELATGLASDENLFSILRSVQSFEELTSVIPIAYGDLGALEAMAHTCVERGERLPGPAPPAIPRSSNVGLLLSPKAAIHRSYPPRSSARPFGPHLRKQCQSIEIYDKYAEGLRYLAAQQTDIPLGHKFAKGLVLALPFNTQFVQSTPLATRTLRDMNQYTISEFFPEPERTILKPRRRSGERRERAVTTAGVSETRPRRGCVKRVRGEEVGTEPGTKRGRRGASGKL